MRRINKQIEQEKPMRLTSALITVALVAVAVNTAMAADMAKASATPHPAMKSEMKGHMMSGKPTPNASTKP
jgi:hypothetical protein